jgi:hypothetical protein
MRARRGLGRRTTLGSPYKRRARQPASGTHVDDELKAVEALVDHADGDQIWQVLDYAERRSVPVAEAYLAIMGELPAQRPT